MQESIHNYEKLFKAWKKFSTGKHNRSDVLRTGFSIEQFLYSLYYDICNKTYIHDQYEQFIICDPKQRSIHKSTVRDRIVHQYIVSEIEISAEQMFIYDSYACRKNKGVHAGVKRLEYFVRSSTQNNTQQIWYLKCDIKKFFDTIDHEILLQQLEKITHPEIYSLFEIIVNSFRVVENKGLPLGNVTSQMCANVYMNCFDHFIKHTKQMRYYIRYADDFLVLHRDREFLEQLLIEIKLFLKTELKLDIHPHKITLKKVSQGIDFLGYIVFPKYTKIRVSTEKRIQKHMRKSGRLETLNSYRGFIKHGNSHRLQRKLEKLYNQNKID